MTKCNLCKKEVWNVIYAGFPMRLCSNGDCNNLTGFWSFIPMFIDPVLPFNGMFLVYEKNYLESLFYWLLS